MNPVIDRQNYDSTSFQRDIFYKYISPNQFNDTNVSEMYNGHPFLSAINNDIRPAHNSDVLKLNSGNKYRGETIKNSSDNVPNNSVDYDAIINQRQGNQEFDSRLYVSFAQQYTIKGMERYECHNPSKEDEVGDGGQSVDGSEDEESMKYHMYPWMKSHIGKIYKSV